MKVNFRSNEPGLVDELSIAHTLRVTLIAMLVSALAFSALTLFLRWRHAPQLALVVGASCLVALVLIRSRQIRAAVLLAVLTITYAVLHLAARSDGIQNIGLAILPLLIVVCSLVLGLSTLVLFTATAILAVIGMLAIRYFVLQAERFSTNDMGDLFIFALTCATAALIGRLLSARIQEGLRVVRASESRYRRIFENIQDVYYEMRGDGTLLDLSPSGAALFGIPREEMIGRPLAPFCANRSEFDALLAAVHTHGRIMNYELAIRDSRESLVYVLVNASLQAGSETGEERMIGSIHDVTDRRRLQEQLQQAQRMESIGRLAGGVAHDFNNLLTSILGYCDLMLGDLASESSLREGLEEVKKAGEQAATLTRQLLAFSRKQLLQPRVLNLNTLIEFNLKILRRLIREDIELVTSLDPALGLVKADAGQLEQVLMNLAANARDAMPQGGSLTIETQNVVLDENYMAQHFSTKSGPYVMLAVSDTGSGMDVETQSKIFDPFFTTKELGRGTGLGLSIVYGIVKQSGGDIWIYSEPGKGTTFKIYLPHTQALPDVPAEAHPLPTSASRSETILVVEDDPGVSKMVVRILRRAGYEVLSAGRGSEALRIVDEGEGRIGLILTDLVMPEMSGPALAGKLKERDPRIRVVYMSGYAEDAVVSNSQLDPDVPFVQKPFSAADVLRQVAEALDRVDEKPGLPDHKTNIN